MMGHSLATIGTRPARNLENAEKKRAQGALWRSREDSNPQHPD